MADIALVTANKVNVVSLTTLQHTSIAAEAITAGAPVLFNAAGKWINADANGTGTVGCWGVATRTVAAGQSLTAVRRGPMDGFALTGMAPGAVVYVSNTVGRLADAAGAASIAVGHVLPVMGTGTNQTMDLILMVDLPSTQTGLSA